MPSESLAFERGTLWARIVQRSAEAIRSGALQPIVTAVRILEQGGIRFLVRVVGNLSRKDQQSNQQYDGAERTPNPFLPYEKDLLVAEIAGTHLCLLNKFNVMEHHLLIVTRSFQDQQTMLSLEDFEALSACMLEFDGLGFYNGGSVAGASQRHKHLQLVPLPLANRGPRVPIEPVLADAKFQGRLGIAEGLPYVHGIARLDEGVLHSPRMAAQAMFECYSALLDKVGLKAECDRAGAEQLRPYNLLVTRQWMLLIPRSRERFATISVNALGFAGTLLVRNHQEMQILEAFGPLTILRRVGLGR